MSTRARQHVAEVRGREQLSEHLVRLTLGGPGLADFASTGVPDEWVGLIVPGQFQSRYYTVRSWAGGELVLDVVVHDVGLVTEWAARDVVGETVTVTDPRGSFAMPDDAAWLLLVGDLTALPAMARTVEHLAGGDVAGQGLGGGARRAPGVPPAGHRRHLARPARRRAERAGGRGRGPRLARRRGLLLDGGGVRADAGDPQAPDA